VDPLSLIVLADFDCLSCYLASRRVDALHAAGGDVDWRAVEHNPQLPVDGQRLGATARHMLTGDAEQLSGVLLSGERLPWVMPAIVPKTQAAVSAYAEAYGAGVGDDVRRLLFTLYWAEGPTSVIPLCCAARWPGRSCAATPTPFRCVSLATR